jgi:predicted dienelactone hydrolase
MNTAGMRQILFMALLAGSFAHASSDLRPSVDAPELARLGEYSVGVKTLRLIQPRQLDVLAYDGSKGAAPLVDRVLTVDLWYPAHSAAHARRVVYSASLPAEPPSPPSKFSIPGIAVRDAAAAGSGFPLVIVSHGYSNATAAMTWLTENLASKGYVVAAIRHEDPPITDRSKFAEPLLRRPLDIAYVAQTLEAMLGAQHLIDPAKTALVGYSMGGYGVLTAAGAVLDPAGGAVKLVPGGMMTPYARGGALAGSLDVKGLKAVVAISPAGAGTLASWGADGVASITVPLLLIAGDNDRTVDYVTGARALFDAATGAHRYLLTFHGAGHALGLNSVPNGMRGKLWDEDWFEDPVWRKDRISAINVHFITAFLDRYVKGDEARAPYLDVAVADSAAGVWPASAPAAAYDAYSPGTGNITVWKGFQRNHAAGLELLQASPR